MVLSSMTFRRVLDLPKVDWSTIGEVKQQQVVARCEELLSQLPQVTQIEGIKKFDGAKYLFEQALIQTLDQLGAPISEETRADYLVSQFLA